MVLNPRHEFHKKCVDPWLKIKQNCPMCKCSITSNASPSNAPPNDDNDFAVEVAVRSGSPVSGESDDISMLNLRHVTAEEGSNGAAQDSDTASSHTSNDPLLGEPRVEIVPYSPQVELNLPLSSGGSSVTEEG